MSRNLLAVRSGNEIFPVSYKNYLPADVNPITGIITEKNRILYIGSQVSGGPLYIYSVNMFTGLTKALGQIPYATLGNAYAGAILTDGTYLYVSISSGVTKIMVFLLSTLELVRTHQLSSNSVTAFGKMLWYDPKTIVITDQYAINFFDIESRTVIRHEQPNSKSWRDFSVGEKLIMLNNGSGTNIVDMYDIENDTYFTATMDDTNGTTSGYRQGKFYIASVQKLYVYDENLKSVITSYAVPWSEPRSISPVQSAVFVSCVNSNKMYVYNMRDEMFTYFILPWNASNWNQWNSSNAMIPLAIEGFVFLTRNTLGIFDYSGYSKYNFGQKYETDTIQFINLYAEEFDYDPRFIEFGESYMCLNDGYIDYPLTETEDDGIKVTTISKADYKYIQSSKFKR